MVAHDVHRLAQLASRPEGSAFHAAADALLQPLAVREGDLRGDRLPDEAVHLAAVDVCERVLRPVRAALVPRVRIMERADAAVSEQIGHADRGTAALHREPVGARVGAEVGVERAVLLHDHHHVPDRVDAGGRVRICGALAAPAADSEQRENDDCGAHCG